MTPSKYLIDVFLKNEEGCILHPYLDDVGKPTIGIGSTYYKTGKPVKMGDPSITLVQAEDLLNWGVLQRSNVISGYIVQKNIKINQNQFDALCSLAYNIGVDRFMKSTVLRLITLDPSNPKITDAFLMWDEETKNGKKIISKDLLARRKREAALYFKPL